MFSAEVNNVCCPKTADEISPDGNMLILLAKTVTDPNLSNVSIELGITIKLLDTL